MDARIVRLEPEHDISARLHAGDITPHRDGVSLTRIVPLTVQVGIGSGASDDLELVAVKMPGVAEGNVIVDDNLNYVAILDEEGIGVHAVDGRVHLVLLWCADGSVESWNLLGKIRDIVDDGAWNAVDEGEVEVELVLLAYGTKKRFLIVGLDGCVVNGWHDGVWESSVWCRVAENLIVLHLPENSGVAIEGAFKQGGIKHAKDCKVGCCILFGGDEHFISLSSTDIKCVCGS